MTWQGGEEQTKYKDSLKEEKKEEKGSGGRSSAYGGKEGHDQTQSHTHMRNDRTTHARSQDFCFIKRTKPKHNSTMK